ncbi:MAG: cardiolipin synthase [Polyangiaceae bacterium]|nr:cardiolipin synthase [Polyangiaceae bacterium]
MLSFPDVLTILPIAIELLGLLLVPFVLLQRKEPPSTVAWILALVFLPGVGLVLYLMFGRERVRVPLRNKVVLDRDLLEKRGPASLRKVALISPPVVEESNEPLIVRELFHVSAALAGAEATHGNRVDLLVSGNATYEALKEAIIAAKHYIFAEYYLLRPDATTDWFLDLLTQAARRGVRVILLMDGYGSFWISRRRLRALREAGGEAVFFLPARLILFQPMNLRNHRKIVVVDGEVAFTGGINIGDEYKGEKAPWRDTHLALRGPCVLPLLLVFAQDYQFAARADIPARFIEMAQSARVSGKATVAIIRSGPDIAGPQRETIHRVLFSAIVAAQKSVFITTPYFIPDRSIIVALQTAAYRGVDVRILFPGKSNHPFVFQAGRSFYEELLAAGVAIYEYGPGMIHAKTMVVDEMVALVGSANMDIRSFRLNFEVHTVIDSAESQTLVQAFHNDLAVSKRVNAEAFKARPITQKVVESAARLMSPLM